MSSPMRNLHSRLRRRIDGEKGISTVEWVGLTAVVLVLLSAIIVYVQVQGGQVGAAAGSSMDEQIELWESGGGRVSPYSDSDLSQGGSPLGGVPGLVPPGGSAARALGVSTEAGQPAGGTADTRPTWRRVWDDLWAFVLHPAHAAGPQFQESSAGGGPSLWSRIWSFVRTNRLVTFILGLRHQSSSASVDELTPRSDEEISQDIDQWLSLHGIHLEDRIDEPPEYYGECVALAKRLAPWIGSADGYAQNYLTEYQNRHGKPAPLLSESVDSVQRGSVLVWEGNGIPGHPLEHGHVAIVAGWYNDELYIVEQNNPLGSPVHAEALSDFNGIHWLPER
jgi:hypothetical protein